MWALSQPSPTGTGQSWGRSQMWGMTKRIGGGRGLPQVAGAEAHADVLAVLALGGAAVHHEVVAQRGVGLSLRVGVVDALRSERVLVGGGGVADDLSAVAVLHDHDDGVVGPAAGGGRRRGGE